MTAFKVLSISVFALVLAAAQHTISEGIARGNNRKKESTRSWMWFDARATMWRMDRDGACFYSVNDYIGDAVCVSSGEEIDQASSVLGNFSFMSVKFFGNAKEVELFAGDSFEGEKFVLNGDLRDTVRARARFKRSGDLIGTPLVGYRSVRVN